jgi:GNAT superfamily N-acetyltransferase
MIGDVNLFLIVKDFDENEAEDMQYLSGELELMIASKENQGQGFGRATLLAFLQYLEVHVQDILREFLEGEERQGRQVLAARELQLGVKIGKENVRSVGLFESLGFERVGGDNYFGEVELKLPRTLNGVEKGKGRWLVEEYRELVYARGGVVEH